MPEGDPLVTVLTTVRNGAAHVAQTLESTRAQTITDWEHIVVDDGSDDDTPAIVARFVDRDPRYRYVRRETPGGPYVAANDGLRLARGRYVARVDADDVSTPHRLAAQIAFVRTHPGLRACGSAWREMDEDGTSDDEVQRFPLSSPPAIKWAVCVVAGLVHSTLVAERAALESVGGYAELPAAADYGMWCALARGNTLGMAPEATLLWRRHGGQMSASRTDLQRDLSVELLREHLAALGDDRWAPEEAAALWSIGRWHPTALRLGFDVLERWERMWRSDAALGAGDRWALFRLANRMRARHVRWNRDRTTSGPLSVAGMVVRGIRPPFRAGRRHR